MLGTCTIFAKIQGQTQVFLNAWENCNNIWLLTQSDTSIENLNVFPLAIHDIKLTKSIFEFIVFVISIDQSIYESLVFQSTNINVTFYIKIMCVGLFDFLSYGIQTHLFFFAIIYCPTVVVSLLLTYQFLYLQKIT